MPAHRYSFADAWLQGLTASVPMIWGTVFSVPPAPTGLVATVDEETGAVTLTWDASTVPAVEFGQYLVHRQVDDGPWLRIDDDTSLAPLTDQATPTFTDWEAPLGRTLTYRVGQTNGALESDAAAAEIEVTAALDGWYLGIPGDPVLNWRLRYIEPSAATDVRDKRQTVRQTMGRTSWMVTTGPQMLPRGHIVLRIHPLHGEGLENLHELSELVPGTHPYAVLRDPFGQVDRVVLGSLSQTKLQMGIITVAFDWYAVRLAAGVAAA